MVVNPIVGFALLGGSYVIAIVLRAFVPRLAGLHFLLLMVLAYLAEVLVIVFLVMVYTGK